MYRKYLAKNTITSEKTLFVTLGALLITALLVTLVVLVTEVASPRDRSTREVAEQYLSAILDGDKQRAWGLIRLEVLCSGAGMEEEVDKQLALFGSSAVRNVTITVRDIGGSVAYNPGTEAADIQFEYRRHDSLDWRVARIGIAVVNYPDRESGFRAICWLWTADTESGYMPFGTTEVWRACRLNEEGAL